MRILVITNLFPDARYPTFGTFLPAHAKALRDAGAEVQVAAIRGVRAHQRLFSKYMRLAALSLALAVRALALRRSPNIVEAHIAYPTGVLALPIARLLGARLVLYCHGSDVTVVGMRSAQHHRLARAVFHRADLLVANSEYIRSRLVHDYGVPPERIAVWTPGVDLQLFAPPARPSRSPDAVVYVGRLDPGKGADVLIRAIAKLPSKATVVLRIVGGGVLQEHLEDLAGRLGVAARFDGPLLPAQVAEVMRGASVVVVPSVHPEGLGLVAIEAMAAGALVVAADSGALSETVREGLTGWLVPPGDENALAAALAAALALDPAAAERVRSAGRSVAARHDIRVQAQRTLQAYSEMIGKAG